MVILIVSSMAATAKVVQPHLDNLANLNGVDHCQGLAEYIILNKGNPSDWGKLVYSVPTVFGLASETRKPYDLDLDKISRLNSDNIYSLNYAEILTALGTNDVTFNIKIHTIFDLSTSLTSTQKGETETTYIFRIFTSKSGFPISTWVRCYTIVGNSIHSISSLTNSTGIGIVNTTLPNSINGTALFVSFAKAKAYPEMMAFDVHSFSHNSEDPQPNGSFLQLSPINHILNIFQQTPATEVSEAHVFTYNFNYDLSETTNGNQSQEYNIPRLLDSSPMILVVNGDNDTTSFIEWTAYPQLPLEIGVDFDLNSQSKVAAFNYIVSIDSVLYTSIITCRSG
jgi:hypothetical protein